MTNPNDLALDSTIEEEPQEEPVHRWISEEVIVTRGWLLFCTMLAFVFVALATYASVKVVTLDNRVTRERLDDTQFAQATTCEAANVRRAEAREIALDDVQTDREIWRAVDDLIEGGIPEPARTTIFDELVQREKRIGEVYVPEICPPPPGVEEPTSSVAAFAAVE